MRKQCTGISWRQVRKNDSRFPKIIGIAEYNINYQVAIAMLLGNAKLLSYNLPLK